MRRRVRATLPAARGGGVPWSHTFVEQEVAFLHDVFVESIFCLPPDSVIDFSAVHRVSQNLLLVLQ